MHAYEADKCNIIALLTISPKKLEESTSHLFQEECKDNCQLCESTMLGRIRDNPLSYIIHIFIESVF